MMLEAKKAAAQKAASLIQNGMIVGLGSGSTARLFIEELIQRCQHGLKIKTVASSRESAEIAKKGNIPVLDLNSIGKIDITVDGADEIDKKNRMIKGGGGAHVREKILASSSDEMVVIVDQSKLVKSLGRVKLPVEVIFYGSPATRAKIEQLGYQGKWRIQEDGTLFITENGNLLFDIQFPSPLRSPEQVHAKLIALPGVVDTGFFFNLAGRVIVGHSDATTTMMKDTVST